VRRHSLVAVAPATAPGGGRPVMMKSPSMRPCATGVLDRTVVHGRVAEAMTKLRDRADGAD
jgi:hypothetical protein